jgi:hypothetical protein
VEEGAVLDFRIENPPHLKQANSFQAAEGSAAVADAASAAANDVPQWGQFQRME